MQRSLRRSLQSEVEPAISDVAVARVADNCPPEVGVVSAGMEESNGVRAMSPAASRADLPLLERAGSAVHAHRPSAEISSHSQGSNREFASTKRRRLSSESLDKM